MTRSLRPSRSRLRVGLASAVLLGAVTVPAVPVVPAAPIAAAAPRTCTTGAPVQRVRAGDTWFGIAAAVEVSMAALLDANDADVDTVIRPGDHVCLPAGATPTVPASATSAVSGAAPEPPACAAASRYEVVSGDSWFQIARRVGVSMAALLDANDADVATVLQPGGRLCLPAGARVSVDVNMLVELEALPVQGPCWYGDTWRAPRGNGRRHEGVDLIVESGNYVYAVADGVLTRRHWDQPGSLSGNAWWLTTADGTYFFYAHLADFAPGLRVGSRVETGEIIGFVGTTGSSATDHLHFEIHPGGGEPINPYRSVRAAGGCRTGEGYRQPNGWVPTD